jgi:transcriptional regulator with XRE-family HTH domain
MKEEILIKFGERIRTLRKQNKWSQWIIRSIPTQFPAKYPEFRK